MRFSGRRARAVLAALLILAHPSAYTEADSARRHVVNPPDGSRTPQANADNYSVRRGNVLTVSAAKGVLANDVDPQSKPLSATLVGTPSHGALFLNGDGSFTYANDGGNAATDSFVYSVVNTAGDTASGRVTITIAADNAPVAANDSYTTAPGTTLNVSAPGVLTNDVDADGDALTAVLIASPAHGSLTLNTNGSFSYTNDGSSAASDSFIYAASDGTLESNAATVSIAIDSAVRANADTYPATQNTPRSVDAPGVLANDLINGAKIASFGATSGTEQTQLGGSTATTAGGTVTLNTDGSLRFTPAPYFAGADTFKYKLANGSTSSTAVVLMMVFAAPSATNDSYSASSGGTTTIAKPGVLSNDTVNSANITGYGASTGVEQTAAGNPTPTAKGGSVTLGADGGFTYTPPKNLTGTDTFKYTLGNVAGTSPATVTIDVSASPFAVNDGYQAPANASTSVTAANGVLANDTTNGAAIVSYGASSATEQASIGASTPTAAGNKIALNSDGSFVYTPNANFSGSDSFKYKLSNSTGTSIGTVSISVTSGPLAVNDSYPVAKDVTLAISAPGLLANDTRNNGSIVSYGASAGTEQTSLGSPAPTAQGGSVSVTADGSFNYAPPASYTGTDTFKYVLANTAGRATATVTLTVSQAPAAVDDSYVAVTAAAMTISAPGVLTNDTLNGGRITTFGANGGEQSALGSAAPTSKGGTVALNANGGFSYTPPSALLGGGTFNDSFRYVLANSSGSSSATVIVMVALNCPTIAIAPTTLPSGAPGFSYGPVAFTATGGSGALTWSTIGGLPAGLSLSASGVLSGTPTVAGTSTVTVRATDANGCSGVSSMALSVSCPSIFITPSTTSGPGTLPTGTTGIAYSAVSFSQSGGSGAISWGVSAGSLPPGLTLSSAGALSGTPSQAGAFTFTVTAVDANGCSASLPLSLTVNARCPAITIAPTALPPAAAGVAYPAISFSQTGGVAPVTWSSSAVPPGMSVSSGGVLSGTPSGVGVFNLTITATDANGCTATLALPLGVGVTCPAIAIPPVNLGTGISGTAYTAVTLSANGGVGTMTWSLAAGTLPAGVTLSGAGVLSGTPTQTGTFNFTVKAADANGCFATRDLSLVVTTKCPSIAIAAPTLPAGVAGRAYAGVSFSQTGGVAPIAWSSGALPAGMTFSAAGVLAGTPAQTGSFNITVIATDANGCTGTLAVTFTVSCPPISVSPSTIAAGVSGSVYSGATFAQTGGVIPIVWDVASGALPTGITLSSAGALAGTPSQTGTFNVTVRATDSNGCSGTQAVSLTVTAKCPAITIAPASLPSGSIGVVYAATSFTQTGGALPVTWTAGALPPGMSFSTAGVLSGTPTTAGVFNLSVTATDANGCTATTSLPFAVGATCPAIAITPSTLAAATASTAYGSVTLSSAGGVGTMTWSVSAGTFPSGMALSTAGVLSGTPTVAGTYAFTVKATDANGCFGTRDFTLTVNPKCGAFTVSPIALAAATAGSAYQAVSFGQSGGTAPITWSAGALPGGMSFSTAGVLAGTPTVRGTFNISVQATDANGCTATLAVPLLINCPTIAVLPVTLSPAAVGTAIGNVTLAQTGAVAPVTWNVTSGALPPGIALSTAGVLSGTPTVAGSSTFTVTVTDANGCTAARALTLDVSPACPAITITPSTLPTAFLGVSYGAFNLTQTGGTGLVTWSSTALPPGMGFSTAGVLSGTPTAIGNYNISVQATDANGCTGTRTYTFTVTCQNMTISPTAIPAGTINTIYSATFAQSGGVTPTTWSISSGTLPPGLSFNSTAGLLNGIPTATGTYTFTVKATAANGCVATQNITLVINCQTITVAPASLSNGFTGLAYTAVAFTQSGATAPVTWSATGLPSGLGLSSAGVLSGTPTVSGTFNSVIVTVTDAAGCVQSRTYSLTITSCNVSVTNPAGTTASTANALSKTFSQSGGTSPVSFKMITTLKSGFNNPAGVAIESDGNIYVADTDNNAIVKWSSYSGTWSTIVTGLLQPQGVALDENNHYIYIADTGNSAIKRTNLSGGSLTTVLSAANGLNHPAGVAVDAGGNVIVADTSNNAIKKYSGVLTTIVSGLNNPSGVAVDGSGNVYIADTGNNAIKKYTGALTTLVSSGLNSPAGVGVDASGNVYIADRGSNAIKMWNGATLTTIASLFAAPQGVGVDGLGRPYVADTGSDSIKVIGTMPGLTFSTAGGLSGIPTLSGTFPMKVIVTDTNGCTGTNASTYDLTVSCSLGVSGLATVNGTVTGSFNTTYSASSVTGTATWSASGLPPGLAINSSTGQVAGAFTNNGVYTATITVSDSAGCSKSMTVVFDVDCLHFGFFDICDV